MTVFIPTVPLYRLTGWHDYIMVGVHGTSAFMIFLGLATVEFHQWRHHSYDEDYDDGNGNHERKPIFSRRRKFMNMFQVFLFFAFLATQAPRRRLAL